MYCGIFNLPLLPAPQENFPLDKREVSFIRCNHFCMLRVSWEWLEGQREESFHTCYLGDIGVILVSCPPQG